jgi:hypothetical protein
MVMAQGVGHADRQAPRDEEGNRGAGAPAEDAVFGQRKSRAGEIAFKKLSASAFYRLLDRLIEIKIPLDTGDFRMISRRALDVLNSMPEQHRFMRGMVVMDRFATGANPL